MSTIAKLRGSDFDSMVARGAFDLLEPLKIELIHAGTCSSASVGGKLQVDSSTWQTGNELAHLCAARYAQST